MTSRKFRPIAETVQALEAAAGRVTRFKQNKTICSWQTPSSAQVPALLALFRRMHINRLVTAKVGAWQKRLILTDVIVNYHELQNTAKTGEEAGELAALMLRAMAAVRTIIETNMPGMTGFCITAGIRDGFWRFQ